MQPRTVTILGSTGSIGTQAIDVVRQHRDRFRVEALSAGGADIALLATQAAELRVASVAVAAHRALDLRHYSRADLILDRAGVAQVLEVSVAPGMTETSAFALAAESAGYNLGALYRQLVESAI